MSDRRFEVTLLDELPRDETFYVIANQASYVSDGGWPGNNETYHYVKFTVYRDRGEWEEYIKTMTAAGHMKGRPLVVHPITPTVTVDVKVPR